MFARMSSAGLLTLGLLGAVSAGAWSTPIMQKADGADVPTFEEPAFDEPAELETPAATLETAETANYSDDKISIDYPATWQVAIDEAGEIAIANVPQVPLDLVETKLYRVDAPPGPLVDANIDSFIEEGAAVSRYRSVTVDGQSALVMWLAERPGELSSAIATFIGYGDETVFLFSRYSPENPTAEAEILSLHGSFSNLELATESEAFENDAPTAIEEEPVLPTEELPLQNEEFQL